MNRRQSWMGYIAIGLGLLALVVALGGRGFGPWERGPIYGFQTRERVVQPPVVPAVPEAPRAENHGFRQHGPFGGARGYHHDGWGFGPGMLLFGLGRLLDTLVKLALLGLLLALGLRFLRGQQGGGAPTTGGDNPPPGGPAGGGTPHTGSTTRL
jgi:hypothetical protein